MVASGCADPAGPPAPVPAAELAALAERTAAVGPWHSGACATLARQGVLARFVPAEDGGTAASECERIELFMAIAERCLTTALVLSQWAAAVRIIAGGAAATRAAWLPRLARGDAFVTVGISQLTTSRQHTGGPALVATPADGAWRLDGVCPWVTGADASDAIVTGAAVATGPPLFFLVPTDAAGLTVEPPLELLALGGSRTSAVRCAGVRPAAVIEPGRAAPGTGGLATSALAAGSARAATAIVRREAEARPALRPIAAELDRELAGLERRLLAAAAAGSDAAARDRLRLEANGLVARAAQAALAASKGAGFVRGHPAERLVREAAFFLVWSCPQSVTHGIMCELAGLGVTATEDPTCAGR